MFKASISQKPFPDEWKKGVIVVPVLKTNPPLGLINRLMYSSYYHFAFSTSKDEKLILHSNDACMIMIDAC